jgi:hypothetical protein
MKTAPAIRRILKLLAISFAAFLLAASGVTFVHAQSTNNIAPAPGSITDVSQFPSLDQLPGKVPSHV